jgi:hypothetical protein
VFNLTVESTAQLIIDTPFSEQLVTQPFQAGWAMDWRASTSPGIDAIHVYAYRIGSAVRRSPGLRRWGTRPDVAAFTDRYLGGVRLQVTGLAPGHYQIVAFGHSEVAERCRGARRERHRAQ